MKDKKVELFLLPQAISVDKPALKKIAELEIRRGKKSQLLGYN